MMARITTDAISDCKMCVLERERERERERILVKVQTDVFGATAIRHAGTRLTSSSGEAISHIQAPVIPTVI